MKPEETVKLAEDVTDLMKEILSAEQFDSVSEYFADLADVYEIAAHTCQAIEQLLTANSTSERIEALDLLDRELLIHLPNHIGHVLRFTDRLGEYLKQQADATSGRGMDSEALGEVT